MSNWIPIISIFIAILSSIAVFVLYFYFDMKLERLKQHYTYRLKDLSSINFHKSKKFWKPEPDTYFYPWDYPQQISLKEIVCFIANHLQLEYIPKSEGGIKVKSKQKDKK